MEGNDRKSDGDLEGRTALRRSSALKGPLIFPRKLASTSERKVAMGSKPCFAHLIQGKKLGFFCAKRDRNRAQRGWIEEK